MTCEICERPMTDLDFIAENDLTYKEVNGQDNSSVRTMISGQKHVHVSCLVDAVKLMTKGHWPTRLNDIENFSSPEPTSSSPKE